MMKKTIFSVMFLVLALSGCAALFGGSNAEGIDIDVELSPLPPQYREV